MDDDRDISIVAKWGDDDDKVENKYKNKCYSKGRYYKEGKTKRTVVDKEGNTHTISDAKYVCKKGEWIIKGSLPDVRKFDIDDIKMISKTVVDPIANAVDDEYTLYTIKLKNGRTLKVKMYGMVPQSWNEKKLKDVGYTGSYPDFMDYDFVEVDDVDATSCTSGGKEYEEGTRTSTLVDDDGSAHSISDAYYVCTDGEWKTEGSYPRYPRFRTSSGGQVQGASVTDVAALLTSLKQQLIALQSSL